MKNFLKENWFEIIATVLFVIMVGLLFLMFLLTVIGTRESNRYTSQFVSQQEELSPSFFSLRALIGGTILF